MGSSVSICQSGAAAEQIDLRFLPIPKLIRNEPDYFVDTFVSEPGDFIDDWAEYYEFVHNGFKQPQI